MSEFDPKYYLKFMQERYKTLDEKALGTFMEFVAVAKLMNGGMEAYFQRMGISHARFKVMINLLYRDADGGMSPAALADVIGVKRATITGILDTLENDQWIARQPDPNDRRGLIIRITQSGIEKLDSVLPAHYERITRAMETLTLEEHAQLTVLIRKFGQGLTAMECSDSDMNEQKDIDSGVERE